MDTRKQLAAVLAQVRSDIDASARKLRHIASEAEELGLNATAAIADEAAEVASDFAMSFAESFKPSAIQQKQSCLREPIVYVTPEALAAMVPSATPKPPTKPAFSIAALLGLR